MISRKNKIVSHYHLYNPQRNLGAVSEEIKSEAGRLCSL